MKIDLDQLQIALLKILAHTRELRGPVVELPDDLYWFIPKEPLVDPARAPEQLTLGSIADDWQQIQRVARGDRDPFYYDLIWASALLRQLGDRDE